jgi:hypothetical protein
MVIEVDRPNRQKRRQRGKSDRLDAVEAARGALSGRCEGIAKSGDGAAEALRALLVSEAAKLRPRPGGDIVMHGGIQQLGCLEVAEVVKSDRGSDGRLHSCLGPPSVGGVGPPRCPPRRVGAEHVAGSALLDVQTAGHHEALDR